MAIEKTYMTFKAFYKCADCGRDFETYQGSRRYFCSECTALHIRESWKKRKKK